MFGQLKDFASLFDLPADLLVNIFEKYLNLRSLARLDSAICNRATRSSFLASLAHVRVQDEASYRTSNLEEWKFDPVLCMRWMVRRSISIHMLVLPDFKTPPVYPPFDEKVFVNLVELHVFDTTGWWEEFLPMCHNVEILELHGNTSSVFFPMHTMSKYLVNLEELRVIGTDMENDYVAESHLHELQYILDCCYFLREVIFFNCELTISTILALIRSEISFLATTGWDNTMWALLHDKSVENVALVGAKWCFFWQDLCLETVARYIKKCPSGDQVVLEAYSRCNEDELTSLVQNMSLDENA